MFTIVVCFAVAVSTPVQLFTRIHFCGYCFGVFDVACKVWLGRVYCSFVIVFEDDGFVGSLGLVVVFCKSVVLGGVVVATITSGGLKLLGDLTWFLALS
jgi:hypothetical protein